METQGKLKLILSILTWVVIAFGLLFAVISMAHGDPGDMEDRAVLDGKVGRLMWVVYLALGLCALAGIVFGVLEFGKNLGKSKTPLIGLVAFALIIIISYAMGSSEVPEAYLEQKNPPTEGDMKLASSLLTATYLLGAGAIIAAVYAAVKNAIK